MKLVATGLLGPVLLRPQIYVVGVLHGVLLPCLQSLSIPGQTHMHTDREDNTV